MKPAVETQKLGPYLWHIKVDGNFMGWASTEWGAKWKAWRLSRRVDARRR